MHILGTQSDLTRLRRITRASWTASRRAARARGEHHWHDISGLTVAGSHARDVDRAATLRRAGDIEEARGAIFGARMTRTFYRCNE